MMVYRPADRNKLKPYCRFVVECTRLAIWVHIAIQTQRRKNKLLQDIYLPANAIGAVRCVIRCRCCALPLGISRPLSDVSAIILL